MIGAGSLQAALLSLLLMAFSGGLAAEPLTGGSGALPGAIVTPDAEAQPRRAAAADSPKFVAPAAEDRSAVAADVPSTSKTVELLLEMQGKNPGLEAGERPKLDTTAVQPSAASGVPAKAAFGGDAALPFGGPEVLGNKPEGRAPEAVDWSEAPPSRFGGGGQPSFGAGAAPREPNRPEAAERLPSSDEDLGIPRKLVRFVKENRDMVVMGSIALLLLLWGISAIASGRGK